MKGHVRTEEYNSKDLESGTIVVYHNKDVLEICAVMHFNPEGDWVITGQTFDELVVPASAELCKLVILTDSNVYPLKFNQWDKAIKNGEVNSDKHVEFGLTPVNKFKEGKRIRTCDVCDTNFMGGGTQFQCKKCNDADAVAQIQVNKKIKPKRPRMISPADHKERCMAVARAARELASRSDEDFEKWLLKQF